MTTSSVRMAVSALILAAGLANCCTGAVCTAYHVSNAGSDINDGKSPAAPWRTIARVNAQKLSPGDSVLFRRGDRWREQLRPRSGDESGYVLYGAYGTGTKPLLMGSVARNSPDDWRHEGNRIWSTVEPINVDVGNLIFDGGKSFAVNKVWSESELKKQGQFWYDRKNHLLKICSTENPATHYSGIECALSSMIISESNVHHAIYENLHLTRGGQYGIGGGATHHIIVRDCDVSFIGGGSLYQSFADGKIRAGNGIEFWADAHDNLVERCRLWEIYDAALTNQSSTQCKQYNITYRNNLIWNCEYSFEYWNRPETSETYNIRFENNTCLNAGQTWAHTQRRDPSGRHLCFYSSPAKAHDIIIRNNIFFEAKGNALYAPGWGDAQIATLVMDHNCWYQASGNMINTKSRTYTMAQFDAWKRERNLEPQSVVGVPMFARSRKLDFHLTAKSPCVDAGMDVGIQADFEGTPIPQGARPDIGAYELRH